MAAAVRKAAEERAAAKAAQAAARLARAAAKAAAAAEKKAALSPIASEEEVRQQAHAEGLVPSARSVTGYHGVAHRPDKSKPFLAHVKRGGKNVSLGSFSTAEEAALCFARSPEG